MQNRKGWEDWWSKFGAIAYLGPKNGEHKIFFFIRGILNYEGSQKIKNA